MYLINNGTTERYHALAAAEATGPEASIIISIFRGTPRSFPYAMDMMERHPLGTQSFFPIDNRPWLVVVSEDVDGKPDTPSVFRASGRQGVNFHRNIWHHPLIALDSTSDFLVVDRKGDGVNLEEHFWDKPFHIPSA